MAVQVQRVARVAAGRQSRAGKISVVAGMAFVSLGPIAGVLLTALLLGWSFQSVLSASMAPRYPAGTLLVVQPIEGTAVRPGMVITFHNPADPLCLLLIG